MNTYYKTNIFYTLNQLDIPIEQSNYGIININTMY